ncbi:MAG: beta-glucosidase [Promethearchaeota archaeon]
MNKINWNKFIGLKNDEIEQKAQEILSMMTLKEKIEQMSGDAPLIRGMISMAKRYNEKPITARECKRLGIPAIKFSDGPRGVVMGNSTCFPVSMARGATWDLNLEERIGDVIGIEAKAQGANFFGGVCINLLRHPAWGRAQETYGEDTILLGAMGTALVKGVQKHIMACAKHFAANSIENSRLKVNVTFDSERTLREVYLPHFKKCVDAGVASIMSAYNKVNGEYCGHNSYLLRDILKNNWDFEGFVISDFLLGIRNGKAAVIGGLDIEMPFTWRMKPKKLLKLIKKGEISEELIDEAVLRILRQKIRFSKEQNPDLYNMDKVVCEEHTKLALEAALKSIVLLKNEQNLLPLDRKQIKKIAVIGRLANKSNIGDEGSSRVYPPYVITPYEGIKNAAKEVEVLYDNGKNLKSAKDLAKNVDVVIIVAGFTHKDEGEILIFKGGDRNSLKLRSKDEKLISAIASVNQNVIVLLEGGSAIIIESWKTKVPAILMVWYPGMEGGNAIGKIIFGDFNPCGKLPLVIPKSSAHLPFFKSKTKAIEYGYYHGYKLMEKKGYKPAYPFGFGLSYTTFAYNNLKIDKDSINSQESINVSVDVTNTGKMDGGEIIQMYVGYINSSIDRPIKDLKGFGKLNLRAGETKTITLELKASDLAYYDAESHDWRIEEIKYVVYVGSSSRKEDLLSTTFMISVSS